MPADDRASSNVEQVEQMDHVRVVVARFFVGMRIDDHGEIFLQVAKEIFSVRIRYELGVLVLQGRQEDFPIELQGPLDIETERELSHLDQLASRVDILCPGGRNVQAA